MKIAVAADHAGYGLKQIVLQDIHAAGHEVTDLGTHDLKTYTQLDMR